MAKNKDVLKKGRTLAVGDVHGCLKSLEELLEWVQPRPDDTVVMLGDYVDRGPNSRGVIDYLINWEWEASLICLKGNHELIMGRAAQSKLHKKCWKEVGGKETLKSYGKARKIPKKHWRFIEETHYFYENDKFIFVHGGVHSRRPLLDQDQEEMCWIRFRDLKLHRSGKVVICGHTQQKGGWPRDQGFAICIDTAVSGGGYLTCLDAEAGKFWQVNEKGKRRKSKLPRKRRKQRKKLLEVS